jgi:pyruvate dehydrogenase E2 component (dihydrolipoamide acetyltransferase)
LAQRIASDTGIDLRQVSGTGPAGRILKSDVELAALSATLSKAALSAQSSPQNSSHSRTGKVRATPAARRLARDDQVDLGRIEGSGPKARIQASDIAAFLNAPTQSEQPQSEAAQQSSSPTLSSTVSFAALPAASAVLRGRRKTIAKRLSQSWQQAPHVTFTMSIDMSQAEALRRQLADDVEQTGGKLTPTVVIAKAVAAALQRHPHLNAWLSQEGQELVLSEQPAVNLGIAVALADGLIVPVVRNAETLGLAALARRIVELAQRARSEQLTPEQVQGATFTLSNLGMYPLDHFTAIINPPQVAILSVARIQLQPVWDGSAFQAKPILQVTLSADHRALDGASAAAFLSEVKRLLEQPARLLL